MAFDGTLKFDTAIDKTGFKTGLGNLGSIAKAGMGVITAAIGAASGAVALIGTKALYAYGDFEQLAGGVETLFGSAAQTVMDNAAEAFQTAGMSANAYMETATASAAAMVNSLAGDTQKAAELTDMAVTDMADNINKMGSSAESVQDAYAGFAKGNFTMLDNLKLGFGGTRQEMERLLQTAEGLTGISYNIDSYADIVQAIHAVQESMGIAGTTAREASETISGSVAAMRSAWDNLLVGIADDTQDFGKLTDDLVTSTETAAGNILPRVETIAGGVVRLIGALGDDVVHILMDALGYAPALVDAGVQLIGAFTDGLKENLPSLLESGGEILDMFLQAACTALPDLLDLGASLLVSIAEGISGRLPDIRKTAGHILRTLSESVSRNLPLILEAGLAILQALGSVLIENLPLLVSCAAVIVQTFCETFLSAENLTALLEAGILLLTTLTNAVLDNLPLLLDAAITVVTALAEGLLSADNILLLIDAAASILMAITDGIADNIDTILLAAEDIISGITDSLSDPENLKKLTETGTKLLMEIIVGLCRIAGSLLGFASRLHDGIDDEISAFRWEDIGKAVLDGILSGITGVDFDSAAFFGDFKDNFVTGIKEIFGIHSPSRVMKDSVGRYLALGIRDGFSGEMTAVGKHCIAAVLTWTQQLPGIGEAAADAFANGITALLEPLPSGIGDILYGALEKVSAWGTSLAQRGSSAASALVSSISGTISSLPGKMYNAGKDLIQGLWNGMSAMGGWLQNKISDLGQSILNDFKSAFGTQASAGAQKTLHTSGTAMGAVTELHKQMQLPGISPAIGSPTSPVIRNYNTSVNTQTRESRPADIHVHVTNVLDGDEISAKVSRRVDETQGEAASLKERGVTA